MPQTSPELTFLLAIADLTTWNADTQQILDQFGHRTAALIGQPLQDIMRVPASGPPDELATQICQSKKPARSDAAGWLGVPIVEDGRVSVIAKFQTDGSHPLSELTLQILMSASGQIGAFLAKDRAQREARERFNELRQAQEQLIQSEKLASLGTIAAGVAHEINNPLSFLLSNLQTLSNYVTKIEEVIRAYAELERYVSPHKDARPLLDRIGEAKLHADLEFILGDHHDLLKESLEGVNRIREIVQSLKTFARANDEAPQEIDVNECILAALRVASNELKYKCDVRKELGELPKISANPGHLLQVFMNILINAAQAIESRGVVLIRTWNAGKTIRITVTDTGSGIAPENISRLFLPFFTTKPVGKGTGLGLSVSYGIIKNLGGTIEVESALGKGSTFTISLPLAGGVT